MELKKCLDFELKRMEAEDRRTKENREFMLQIFQCFRPPPHFPTFMAPHANVINLHIFYVFYQSIFFSFYYLDTYTYVLIPTQTHSK